MKTQKKVPETVSEIIAGALDVFGPTGKHWNDFTIQSGNTYCSLGAIHKAAGTLNNGATFPYGSMEYWEASKVAKEACNLVLETANEYNKKKRGFLSIPSWNDSRGKKGFPEIKAVFCAALKKALEQEKAKQAKVKNVTKKTTAKPRSKAKRNSE